MKRIVICCDGSGADKLERQPSNVLMMYRATRGFEPGQIAWYEAGVGTGTLWNRFGGGVYGDGLTRNIQRAYMHLVEHYEPGDEVFLFGWSRGAFTVRSLVGLIKNIGLLTPERAACFPVGLEMYRRKTCGPNSDIARRFREQNSIDMPVKFMGVWGTVGSMGIPARRFSRDGSWMKKYGFHDERLTTMVENAYQALAIDEKRGTFKPVIWHDPEAPKPDSTEANKSDDDLIKQHPACFAESGSVSVAIVRPKQIVVQEWFRGCHSDIGGTNVPAGLSNLTFHWLTNRAKDFNLQINEAGDRHLQINERYAALHANLGVKQEIHESLHWIYRILPKYRRPIGMTYPKMEAINASVLELVESSPETYHPKNLTDYFSRHPRLLQDND
jgi:uncharacterized protein (DUF2235 family)